MMISHENENQFCQLLIANLISARIYHICWETAQMWQDMAAGVSKMVKCIFSVNPPAEFIVKEEGPAYACVNVMYI